MKVSPDEPRRKILLTFPVACNLYDSMRSQKLFDLLKQEEVLTTSLAETARRAGATQITLRAIQDLKDMNLEARHFLADSFQPGEAGLQRMLDWLLTIVDTRYSDDDQWNMLKTARELTNMLHAHENRAGGI
jgi:hypothetical protein